MKYTIRFMVIMCSIMNATNTLYSITFKNITTWAYGYKEERFYKKYSFEQQENQRRQLVIINNHYNCTIVIKSWSLPKIAIDAVKSAREKDLSKISMAIEVNGHVASIKTLGQDTFHQGIIDFNIIVPQETDIKIISTRGTIKIKNIDGIIEIKLEQGSIDILHASNSLFLMNNNGPVKASLRHIAPTNQIMINAQGSIELAIPLDAQADIHAKTINGQIHSDHYLTLKPITIKLNQQTWTKLTREISATLGAGGTQINLSSEHGPIKLLEY